MSAIVEMLKEAVPSELSANVTLYGSNDFNQAAPATNTLAIYLYRLSVDPTMVGGYLRAKPGAPRTPEISVMLHFLIFAMAQSASAEVDLMGWSFQQLAMTPVIGADRLTAQNLVALPANAPPLVWDDCDSVQVATEELTREELMRIWDTLPLKYHLTVPYVARGLRLTLSPDLRQYPQVVDRSFLMERTS
jgi:hypothetical protein